MIVAHNMSRTVFAYPSSAFVCLRGNCTGFQLDNIVNRIQHAFSFKMIYRNLGNQGAATNSVISPLTWFHRTYYIELKLYFNSRHHQHRFSAQRKMQHLRFSWRNPCIWKVDFCQIIKSYSCFWMDHKSKQVYSLIDRFWSIYDVRR